MKTKEYSYDFEITIRMDDGEEFTKLCTMELECTEPFHPGHFDMHNGGEPPSGPEFDCLGLLIQREYDGDYIGINPLYDPWTWGNACNFFGEKRLQAVFEDACEQAAETGDF